MEALSSIGMKLEHYWEELMLGSLFWLESIKYAGAFRVATLGATAPVFALPPSMVLLGASISWNELS
jgi:drug/metabolite transporter (DMT)-like permease